jgi:hypothetical protein
VRTGWRVERAGCSVSSTPGLDRQRSTGIRTQPMPRHVFYEWLARRGAAARGRAGMIDRVLDVAAHFVLPDWCAGCDQPLPWRVSPLGLCSGCRAGLPPPPSLQGSPPALDG